MDPEVAARHTSPRWSAEELALLELAKAGDHEACQHLLRPHVAALLAMARRLTGDVHWAEDLLQETLLRAFQGLSGFRGSSSLKTWLFRIEIHLHQEPQRWQRRDRAGSLAGLEVPDNLQASAADSAIGRELVERIQEAMERLPARQRTALHLRAVEGFDYQGIAEVLGCSTGAARMLVLAARTKVEERLGRYLEP